MRQIRVVGRENGYDLRMSVGMQTPSIIGRYQLVAEIGRGGMGDVYLAVAAGPAGFEKLVVLKTLQQVHAQDHGFVDMFMDEARLAARLSHPHIVQTNEVDVHDGIYFMAMEFLDGQPLQRLRSNRVKPPGTAAVELAALSQALLGLHHAHELHGLDGAPLGVVHRDATPHNIFLTYDGFAKVVDFGIAKAMNSSHQTVVGTVKGKVRYMAPEQSIGGYVDRRSDVFSVGVAAWEAVSRQRMWPVDQPDVYVLHELSQGRIPQLRTLNVDAPPGLIAVCERACAAHPDDRYPTALAFHDALEQAVAPYPEWSASSKTIAHYMETTFGEERRRFRGKVDQQLALMRGARAGDLRAPLLAPNDLARSSLTPSSHLTASLRQSPSITGASLSVSNVARENPLSLAGTSPNVTIPGRSRPRSVAVIALAATALIGVVGTVGYLGYRITKAEKSGGPASTVGAVTEVPSVTAVSGTPSAKRIADTDTILLELSATPASATLTLDGRALPGNPTSKSFPRDDKTHVLLVSAPGYTTREVAITFDGNAKFDVPLSRGHGQVRFEPPSTTRDPQQGKVDTIPAAPTAPVFQPSTEPAGPKKPLRTVDTAYPGL
jgi:eukaryotic-like serine/threonine-protein kinase